MFICKINKSFILTTLYFFYFTLELCVCESTTREIKFLINPNCTEECEKPWLIYGRGENIVSTVHYLWSCQEIPTFVIANAVPESSLSINWTAFENFHSGSVAINPVPNSVLGISFQKLILFDDVNDEGKIDNVPEDRKIYIPTSDFEWVLVNEVNNESSQEVSIYFQTTSFRGSVLPNDTKISFKITAFGKDGRNTILPHLITTPNSAHLDVTLDNLILDINNTIFEDIVKKHKSTVTPIGGFDHPRWALDMIMVSDDTSELTNEGFQYTSKKSLDDEYSPGVFNLDSVATPKAAQYSGQSNNGSYLQWRPVVYSTSDRDINFSTYPNMNTSFPPIDEEHLISAENSLIYVLFGDNTKNLLGAQNIVAFGLTNDEFYTKYSYAVWTVAMGLGDAPKENVSSFMIVVISVGFGLPMLLFLVGGVYLATKKYRQRGELLISE